MRVRGASDGGEQGLGAAGARIDLRRPQQWDDAVVCVGEHTRCSGAGAGDLGWSLVEVNDLERNGKARPLLAPLRALAQAQSVRDVAQAAVRPAAELAECIGELARDGPAGVVDAG